MYNYSNEMPNNNNVIVQIKMEGFGTKIYWLATTAVSHQTVSQRQMLLT